MTGHQSHNQAQPPTPEEGLQRLVTQIGHDRQGAHPLLTALAEPEAKMLRAFAKNYPPERDTTDAGAALLVFGELCANLVTRLPEATQQNAGSLFINLARLVGEALMSNRLAPTALRCPYRYAHGAECKYLAEAPDEERRDATMRAHVGLHHPDQTWPCEHKECVVLEADHAVCTACGALVTPPDDAEITELVPAAPTATELECETDRPERIAPEDCPHPKHARVRLPGGTRCSACGTPEIDLRDAEPKGGTVTPEIIDQVLQRSWDSAHGHADSTDG